MILLALSLSYPYAIAFLFHLLQTVVLSFPPYPLFACLSISRITYHSIISFNFVRRSDPASVTFIAAVIYCSFFLVPF
jgi:hypothetical protein